MSEAIQIHPSVDQGVKAGARRTSPAGTLVCKCAQSPVKVAIKGHVAYDHACGCTKCWKPAGAIFSVVAVVPRANLSVTENGEQTRQSWTRMRQSSATPARDAAFICTAG